MSGEPEEIKWIADTVSFGIADRKAWDRDWDDGYYGTDEDVDGHRWAGIVFWNDDTPRDVFWFADQEGAKRGMESLAFLFLANPELDREDAQRVFSKVLGSARLAPVSSPARLQKTGAGPVDVSRYAREAGLEMPTFMTAAAHAATLQMPPAVVKMGIQSESGRARDVFMQLLFASGGQSISAHRRGEGWGSSGAGPIPFRVSVNNHGRGGSSIVNLVAVFKSGKLSGCTIMLADEAS